MLAALIILGSLIDVRTLYGQPLIGSDWQEMLVTLAIYGGLLASMGLMGFGLLCGYDFARRVRASELYYRALMPPGLQLKMPDGQSDIFSSTSIQAQLRQWMGAVACCRARFANVFTAACKSYTSLLISYSVLCVGLLNFMMWTQIPHQAATAVTMGTTVFVISFIGSYAMYGSKG